MLYIVATPIGNLKDITLRALEVLREVDIILCEDTRVTIKLLNHYQVTGKRLISYHHHTSDEKMAVLVGLIKDNKVALVTDAGTPGISDPGGKIINELHDKAEIIALPGPSALTAALSVSGLPTDKFLFLGFAPHKKGRNKFLREVMESSRTVAIYESPHRIIKCLEQILELEKELNKKKQFVVCRELTKKFETIYRGTIGEVLEAVKNDPVRGEYAVVVN
ncbi:16S rRNA (cytidine(1402)-2'-O)-methyltransferase [Candidatus Kuenenbacteria bacterium CG_4_9_14_3_um_filter_39_14]|uniref:Ribosomal RNA small subunit methyltransferase I n=7 Tax=Candidatus Kueneniibacteriota TaxID=1752740 RepID=A0A2M7IL52_9BACT|nr:16S rRNA (cytidine(1402)-2'-O)-methyltransferase [Candidatus Kuenenbacteria bacterium]OIP55726.1 MAG: 16S rRNA (cytidine(1402)-2'-O)-methyltransferase [Candidatus Kuenenbacteria bacterium CG2_30_39_24]PIP29218.1 MAG: 16S rRNA (cytidine(1402)-2'-O)-methyltransferase [Candidatus Kuenenbacteria bacterium CG23_combo_of_CG06-09_8_20_14_all_39_39]PIP75359.1 MAG: 16S rRNA (cytidine(1402)-2'-O)-methyltransferase [Candidatus Kuenenbacteria bacterium CG22_combo_CG10-13_8_21_14_all_39_9]PIR80798.1 MAG: